MPRTALRMLSVFSMLAWSACGDGDERTVQITEDCAPLDICSITDRACQQALLELTACVRGDEETKLPEVRTLSRAQLAEELAKAIGTSEEQPSEATRAVEQTFAALHLISPATTLTDAVATQQAASIAAYYRGEEEDITIVSDTLMDREAAMNVLAHELTHYLQDRTGQLKRPTTNVTLDESVARRALTEGDAVVTSYRASAATRGISPSQIHWDRLWAQIEDEIVAATDAAASPLMAAITQLPYLISPPTLELAWERGGRDHVEQFFDSPPATQLDWLEGSIVYSQAEALDCFPALPPDGYELISADSLGIAGVFGLSAALDLDRASLDLAREWRQDRLAIYVDKAAADAGTLETLAAWRIRFSDSSSASEFERLVEMLELDITRTGSELSILVGSWDASGCPTDEQFAATARRGRDVDASLRAALGRFNHH